GHDGPTVDHQVLIRMIEEIEQSGELSVAVQRVEILDQNGGAVLAVGDLSSISSIAISGGAGNDVFTIDRDSFGDHTLPAIDIDGDGGSDKLVFESATDTDWRIGSANAGIVSTVSFSSIENLAGAANNDDTFTVAYGASVDGVIDGGSGGFDSLYFDGVYDTAF